MNKYGLLGFKLSHSYSPLIHDYLFKANGLDCSYYLCEISEAELGDYINKLRLGEYSGFNVTIPYKEKIIPFVDELSEAARAIGAVNVVYLESNKVIGDNTDYYGFMKQLEYQKIEIANKKIYILGSGGAAKAVMYAVSQLGGCPTIVSRHGSFSYHDLAKIERIDVLINTTPLGMYPNIDSAAVDKEIIDRALVCVDVIFNPRQTKFLAMKNQHNDGLPMLIFQAVRSQEIWQKKKMSFCYQSICNLIEGKDSNE